MRYLFGHYALDPDRRELCRSGNAIHVEPQVFDLLVHLVRNRDHVVSKDDLLSAVWQGRIVSESTFSNRINAARRAIGDSGEQQQFIRTVARRGLRFIGDVREEPINSRNFNGASRSSVTAGSAGGRSATPQQEVTFCRASDGVRLAVATSGNGLPLVKAANWLNHIEYDWHSPVWSPSLKLLASRFQVIRYDERGTGLSDWDVEDISFDAFVRDLETVVDTLGLERFALLGISQGAAVSIAYAAQHPDRVSCLVLSGGYALGWRKRANADEIARRDALLTVIRHGWAQDTPAFRQVFTSLLIPDASEEQMQWFNDLERVSTSPENAVRLMKTFSDIDVSDLMSRVAAPTLVLHSRGDAGTPFEQGLVLARSIPNARFVALESRNHLILSHEAAWPRYMDEICGFVGGQGTVGAAGQPPTSHLVEEVPDPPSDHKTETDAGAAVASPSELRGKPVVAVLPFNNMSGDPGQEYFSDGITEDIITALSKYRSLLVIARNSAFAFKGYGSDVRHIGTKLGADYLVEGSVRKLAGRLRVTAHLIETEGGRLVWADQYDRDLEEIFGVQDAITSTIAARIEPGVGTAERLRAERKPPEALRAWDFFHLGTKHFYKFTIADNLEAQRLLRHAIELDPTLAQAHAFLSWAIVLSMIYFDVYPDDRRLDEAIAIARKGVELDAEDALIRFMYGRALLARRAYGDALAELESALQLNPSLPPVYCGLGDSLAYEDRFSEAFPYFQKAIDLGAYDPQRWAFYSYRSLAHLFARQFPEALEWAQKATRIPNCHYWPFAHRVSAIGHLRGVDGANVAISELLQRKPAFSCSFACTRLFYVKNAAHLEIYVEGLRRAGIPE